MGLQHHGHDRHAQNDRAHPYVHDYRHHHNVNGCHADDSFHIRGCAPVDHICPDADYKMHPQNLDHESMNRRYSRFALPQRYCQHGVLFPIHHHGHAHNLAQYNHWLYA